MKIFWNNFLFILNWIFLGRLLFVFNFLLEIIVQREKLYQKAFYCIKKSHWKPGILKVLEAFKIDQYSLSSVAAWSWSWSDPEFYSADFVAFSIWYKTSNKSKTFVQLITHTSLSWSCIFCSLSRKICRNLSMQKLLWTFIYKILKLFLHALLFEFSREFNRICAQELRHNCIFPVATPPWISTSSPESNPPNSKSSICWHLNLTKNAVFKILSKISFESFGIWKIWKASNKIFVCQMN